MEPSNQGHTYDSWRVLSEQISRERFVGKSECYLTESVRMKKARKKETGKDQRI